MVVERTPGCTASFFFFFFNFIRRTLKKYPKLFVDEFESPIN